MNSRRKNALVSFAIGLIVLLFPNSLNAQTGAGRNALSDYAGVQLETQIRKGDRAPFEGVLVPYPQYYYYQETVEVNFEREIHPPECDCLRPIGVGFLAGVSATLLLAVAFSASQ